MLLICTLGFHQVTHIHIFGFSSVTSMMSMTLLVIKNKSDYVSKTLNVSVIDVFIWAQSRQGRLSHIPVKIANFNKNDINTTVENYLDK